MSHSMGLLIGTIIAIATLYFAFRDKLVSHFEDRHQGKDPEILVLRFAVGAFLLVPLFALLWWYGVMPTLDVHLSREALMNHNLHASQMKGQYYALVAQEGYDGDLQFPDWYLIPLVFIWSLCVLWPAMFFKAIGDYLPGRLVAAVLLFFLAGAPLFILLVGAGEPFFKVNQEFAKNRMQAFSGVINSAMTIQNRLKGKLELERPYAMPPSWAPTRDHPKMIVLTEQGAIKFPAISREYWPIDASDVDLILRISRWNDPDVVWNKYIVDPITRQKNLVGKIYGSSGINYELHDVKRNQALLLASVNDTLGSALDDLFRCGFLPKK